MPSLLARCAVVALVFGLAASSEFVGSSAKEAGRATSESWMTRHPDPTIALLDEHRACTIRCTRSTPEVDCLGQCEAEMAANLNELTP